MICEDEALLAIDLQMALEAAGAEICGIASSRSEALALMDETSPDLVVLDVELSDGACVDVAERLTERGVPFLIVTGFDGPSQAPPAFAQTKWLLKPVNEAELVSAVSVLLAARGEMSPSCARADGSR
ncbi:MAG: response regulator [Beijerinckiaceae bacterium]|nr:response regulator [Beijerinckiaceae bacterium]